MKTESKNVGQGPGKDIQHRTQFIEYLKNKAMIYSIQCQLSTDVNLGLFPDTPHTSVSAE